MLAMNEEIATSIGRDKIMNVREAGASGIVTACVFCDIQLTQVQFGDGFEKDYQIPIIPITQLLGPALGIGGEILGFELNKIRPISILETQEVQH